MSTERQEARSAAPILRDEAYDALLSRIEDDYSVASLTVRVDHGEFVAMLEGPEVVYVEGDRLPSLTDALCSLEGRMRGL